MPPLVTPCMLLVSLATGFLLGSLSKPPTELHAASAWHGAGEAPSWSSRGRASPLVTVTRELAAERKRAQALDDSLAEERVARRGCVRRAMQVPARAGWPCGLHSTRLDQARWRRQWCWAAQNATSPGAARGGAPDCTPPQPDVDYVILTYSPEHDSASAKVAERGGFVAQHHLPWLDEALAFEAGGAVVDLGAHFGQTAALYALARGAAVVAVDDRPRAVHALRLAAALNGWEAQLTTHELPLRGSGGSGGSEGPTERCEGGGRGGASSATASIDEVLEGLASPIAYLRVGSRVTEAAVVGALNATLGSGELLQPRFVGISLRHLAASTTSAGATAGEAAGAEASVSSSSSASSASRGALAALYAHGYVCSPFTHGPPLRGAAWDAPGDGGAVTWGVDANEEFLRRRETYWDVRCVSQLVQRHLWRRTK